jgi:hypothetical protein
VDGDENRATARSTILIYDLKTAPASLFIAGTFEDVLVRTSGEWRIAYRAVSLLS